MKKTALAVIILLIQVIFILSGCTATTGDNIAFGTFYNIKLKGAKSYKNINLIESLFEEIEQQTSTDIKESDIYKINNADSNYPTPIRSHTKALFLLSKKMYLDTQGAFNATIFPLVELWNFSPSRFKHNIDHLPSSEEVNNLLPICNFNYFELDEKQNTITKLHKNAKLDFGGIAKGYAVDLARNLAHSNSDSLINVGGNISAFGKTKKIGLTHPRDNNTLFGIVSMANESIASSGDYERFYFFNNIRYCHIIGKDGYPISSNANDIIAVYIIGKEAVLCDIYSTTVMILGVEWAEKNLVELGYRCIVITKNNYKIIGELNFESRQSTHQKV